jgi:hypothetical protein
MWRRARRLFAAWGWALLAVLGLVLAGIGLGLGWSRSGGFQDPWAATALSFAQAILAAGMVTGVMRAAQAAGFFRDQLREVIYDDPLEDSLIDAKKAWRSLTRGLFRQRFAHLPRGRLDRLSVDSLIGSAEFFYESHWRQIDIDWADREKGLLQIAQSVSATLRTADLDRRVPFTNRYQPEAPENPKRSFKYEFTGDKGLRKTVTEADVPVAADGTQEMIVDLDPNDRVVVKLTATTVQRLNSDPFLSFESTCLWADPEIVVSTPKRSALRFYFREMGVSEPFLAKDGSNIDGPLSALNAQCKALCLPGQGYMIVVVSVD